MNCWEFKRCGREAGGSKAAELGVCAAYPSGGHACAMIAGTLCGGRVQGSFAQKLSTCLECDFYRSEHYTRLGAGVARPGATPAAFAPVAATAAGQSCWEVMACGREAGGARSRELGVCPAWPSHGRSCARVAGTLCDGKVAGTFAQKLASCLSCRFYMSPSYDRSAIG
ncbi:MAG TPA: hypothetical protein VGQ83_03520 [Polyangia bacterium]|jgi:hypothetical protein